jgi:MFS family permease
VEEPAVRCLPPVHTAMAYSWFILLLTLAGTAFLLLLLQGTPFGTVLHERIPDRPRRRLFVASVSFFLSFAGVRAVVYAIEHHIPPFHFIIQPSGRHIHHLVFGILILLFVGYGWLADIGTGEDNSSILLSRLMSILYGVGAALTLDEFALWLNLRDVYWSAEGRSSIDAIILFGAFLAASAWGAPLLQPRNKTKPN